MCEFKAVAPYNKVLPNNKFKVAVDALKVILSYKFKNEKDNNHTPIMEVEVEVGSTIIGLFAYNSVPF